MEGETERKRKGERGAKMEETQNEGKSEREARRGRK